MDRHLLKADVTIKLEGPLSISMPVAEHTRENQWKNFPVMPRGVDAEGQPKLTGYLPATTVRGALRRGIVLPKMEAAATAGRPYSLDQAYGELIGQDAASEKQPDEINLVEIEEMREASPVIDLFGSGLGVASRLRVSHFLPEVDVLPISLTTVRKDVGQTEGVLETLSADDRRTYHAREEANRNRAQQSALVESLTREMRKAERKGEDIAGLRQQLEAAQALVAKYQDLMGDMRNSSRHLPTLYALPMGLELKGKLVVRDAKTRDLEMLVTALDQLSRFPVLGAQSARGCGEVSGTAEFRWNQELVQVVSFGGFESAQTRVVSEVSLA